MPRRAAAGVRPLDPDAVYGSKLVQQVINKVMIDGKKSTSEKIVYDALELLSRSTNHEPAQALQGRVRLCGLCRPLRVRLALARRRPLEPRLLIVNPQPLHGQTAHEQEQHPAEQLQPEAVPDVGHDLVEVRLEPAAVVQLRRVQRQ